MEQITLDYITCLALDLREAKEGLNVLRNSPNPPPNKADLVIDYQEFIESIETEAMRYG